MAGAMQAEAGGLRRGGEQLRRARVGEAVHAECVPLDSGRWREPGESPLGAVAGFVAEGIEGSLGAAAAADVLDDYVVTVAREPGRVRVGDGRGDVAAVGLAHAGGWGVGAMAREDSSGRRRRVGAVG